MLFWTTYYSFIASGLQFQAVFSEVLFETNKQTNETKQNKTKGRADIILCLLSIYDWASSVTNFWSFGKM